MDKDQATAKIAELMDGAFICYLSSIDDDGQIVSRPMSLQTDEFKGELWFFTTDHSGVVSHINKRPQVNVAFENKNSHISISGEAQAVADRSKAEELWSPSMKAWFPDGVETEDLILLRVNATSAHYWDAPNSKVITLFGVAKAAVTGKRPDLGEDKVVDLD